jgi:hypothetical protein
MRGGRARIRRPAVDALEQPTFLALDVGVADEDRPAPALDDDGAADPARYPAAEALRIPLERIGAILLAQACAGRLDQ